MSFCPECGKSVGSSQKYCRNCGASLVEESPAAVRLAYTPPTGVEFVAGALVCRACGYPIKPGDKFCSKCLMKIPDDLAAAPAACLVPPLATQLVPPILPLQNTTKPIPPTGAVSAPYGTLVCRACGNPIKSGEKFCSKCLVKVPDRPAPTAAFSAPPAATAPANYVCASCGSPASGSVKFCGICGTPFVAAKPLASSSAPKAHPAGKFCGSCGAAISGTVKFCGSCGVAVNTSPPGRL